MITLVIGLAIFLGIHSIHMLAPQWRESMIRQMGLMPWKGLYSIISLAGFGLIIWGYGLARLDPVWVWFAPGWTRHLSALLMIPAFIFLAAAYVPGNRIKARFGHPMVLAVKTWAIAHLIANGTLADILLFGGFLAWAVVYFIHARRKDRANNTQYPVKGLKSDISAVVGGLIGYGVFAFWAHLLLIGVPPFG
ncbi:NnrU family protein [Saccharospirillum impatiens]|uniref:NnrU family protein n=1 Tax=Saccharospirillum impatiens TaxID=169438 RepID=UPI0003FCAE8E|nr:NnrU family protein [Saccharospirillum impatiens]